MCNATLTWGANLGRRLERLSPSQPRQGLRKGRQKSIFPQGSDFQKWKQAQVPVLNEFTPCNSLVWKVRGEARAVPGTFVGEGAALC